MLTTKTLLALMLWLSPPELVTSHHLASEGYETREARVARYERIAEDTLAVADAVAPLLGSRDNTALLLTATTFHESDGWHWAVDEGGLRGDGGSSACIAQIHLTRAATPEGWTLAELATDRRKCLWVAARVLRASLVQCRDAPLAERLSAYVSGDCTVSAATSVARMKTFNRMVHQVEALGGTG